MHGIHKDKEEQYPVDIVKEALQILPDELAQGVVTRIAEITAERKSELEVHRAKFYTAELAIAAHQNVQTEVPSGLDVINWERGTRDASLALLHVYKSLNTEQRELIPDSAVEFAACYYAQREPEEVNPELFESVGYTLDSVHGKFIDLIFETSTGTQSRTALEKVFPSMEYLECCLPAGLNKVAQALEEPMRRDLIAAGFMLPELQPDNTYGYDEDKERYRIPVVDNNTLPN